MNLSRRGLLAGVLAAPFAPAAAPPGETIALTSDPTWDLWEATWPRAPRPLLIAYSVTPARSAVPGEVAFDVQVDFPDKLPAGWLPDFDGVEIRSVP